MYNVVCEKYRIITLVNHTILERAIAHCSMGIAHNLANTASVEDLSRCTEVGVEVLGPNTT